MIDPWRVTGLGSPDGSPPPGRRPYRPPASRVPAAKDSTGSRCDGDGTPTVRPDGGVPTAAVDGAGQAISVLDEAGRFEYVNDAFVDLTGYDREDVLGAPWEELYPERDVLRVAEAVVPDAVDEPWSGESIWERADGERVVVDHSLSLTEDGRLVCVAQRLHNRSPSGREDPLYDDAVAAIQRETDGVFAVVDPAGRLVDWNDELEAVTGYDAATLAGMHGAELVSPSDVERVTAAVAGALRSGRGAVEVDIQTRGGTTLPYELVATRLGDGDVPSGLAIMGRGIRTRRDLRPELSTADRALADLLDLGEQLDLPFEERLNAGLQLGRERLGLSYGFLTRIAGDVQEVVVAQGDHALLQAGESCPLTQAYCRKTIREDTLLGIHDAVAAGMEDDRAYQTFDLGSYIGGKVIVDGSLYGTICFADTEPREEAFSEEEEAFVEALCSWMAAEMSANGSGEAVGDHHERMEEFASMAAHDLRGPLSVAHGNLAMAAEDHDSERIEAAADAVDRMDDLISDMLSLARSGEAVDDPDTVDVGAVAREAWGTVGTWSADLVVENDLRIKADRDRLLQLFENLFRNAIEHGGESVSVRVGGTDDGLYVADDGPGISEDDRERVFERGFTTETDGSGLGLDIVNAIAGAHGWRSDVTESAEGGARFEFNYVDVPDAARAGEESTTG